MDDGIDYEAQRLANMAANRKLLEELGLHECKLPAAPKKVSKLRAKRPLTKKRRPSRLPLSESEESDTELPTPKKLKRDTDGGEENIQGRRRSLRNTRRVSYANDGQNIKRAQSPPSSPDWKVRKSSRRSLPRIIDETKQRQVSKLGPRLHDPKQYGAIPGVPVGMVFETRQAASQAAIHAPWVAGISAGKDGAYSVALSGGYDDDVDMGDGFTFTGAGGRDLKGTKQNPKNLRTAPQSCDQTFDSPLNKSLQRSAQTRNPVRVLRGFKLNSPYAPSSGYRYDGLYVVEKAWTEQGLQGFKVCKYAFKRLPDQPELLVTSEEQDESEAESSDHSTMSSTPEATPESEDD
ncbi:PUA-like domain-containing protein [Cantharellus anzutake]|uniref:PUA-like domain-containing protein n=1 Tax=Cantharellus anzutake TaxID=1750568 RepID=UPI00190855B3|nr:PUA-like domain-containing protein [Cantharellus anzutake]KAF8324279.1 PUA-like domain-containing protein [Cantharellus anzutake]